MLDFHQRALQSLARIEQTQQDQGRLLAVILQKVNAMALDTSALLAKVSALETVQASAIALLQGLNAAVKAIPTTDPATQAAIDALTARLDTDTTTLASAVAANTIAAPAPSPTPTAPSTPPAA